MPELINLVYSSKAVRPMTEHELNQLLTQARAKNNRLNITGMLLYHRQAFLQVLEGSISNVESVFSAIVKDTRHHNVTLLLKRQIDQREYSDWHMKFNNLDVLDLRKIQGYAPYKEAKFDSKAFESSNFIFTFLHLFKDL